MQSGIVPAEDVLEEAAAWVARLHADDRTEADEARFRTWIAASHENAAAFEAMDRGWTILGSVPPAPRPAAHALSRRKLVMAGLGGGLVVGTSFLALRPAAAQSYETAVGEQKHVTLADGSRIFLDASTKLTVTIDNDERTADLAYGRASFDIAMDGNRPFIVSAGTRRLVSQAASFNVGRDADQVQVILVRGKLDVRNGDAAAVQKMLQEGDRLVSNGNTVRVDRPRLAPLVAWQTRTAIFDDNSLADAVREMNLYSPAKLEIADAPTGMLRVSGIYQVGDNAAFARSIAKFLPVQVNQQGGHLILRRNASNG